jgi:hypothetical protein
MRGGAHTQFFDQNQFRRWWNTPSSTPTLGAKRVDVVLLEGYR